MACRLISSTALCAARISLPAKPRLPTAVSFLTRPALRLNVPRSALFNTSARLFDSSHNAAAAEAPVAANKEPVKPRFDSITQMHPKTAQAIKQEFRYETMSDVQHAVLSKLPRSDDMFVKAKTGTGKTLAFLIPAIETLLAKRRERKDNKGSIIIVSPTRELAMQIESEAQRLCRFHHLKTHLLVGGNSKYTQITQLNRYPPDIIVGTPGRLQDMQNTVGQVRDACMDADVLILDEADVLLEMGFREAMEEFVRGVRIQRQTLLFSATVSTAIRSIANIALRENFTYLDLVGEAQANVHLHIPQRYAIHNTAKHPELAHRIIVDAAKNDHNSKVIVFLPTTKMTMIYAAYLRGAGVRNLVELHSGLAQQKRTRVSDRFRQLSHGVLVTSDVSARGVDYPNVSLVLQMGIPENREQYIHRIGRTGRAGKSGQAMIILSPWEDGFLKELKDIPITESEDWSATVMADKHQAGQLEDPIGDEERKRASRSLDVDEVHPAIISMLGFYASKGKLCGFNKLDIPSNIAELSKAFDMEPPTFNPEFVAKVLGGHGSKVIRRGGKGGRGGFGGREGGFSRGRY